MISIMSILALSDNYRIKYSSISLISGMLLVGGMLSNIPVIKTVGQGLDLQWSGALRYNNNLTKLIGFLPTVYEDMSG